MDEAAKAAAAAERDAVLSVDCPVCGVGPGKRCCDLISGRPSNLVHGARTTHWKQIHAEEAHDRAGEAFYEATYGPFNAGPGGT